jgi:hypothetical protein
MTRDSQHKACRYVPPDAFNPFYSQGKVQSALPALAAHHNACEKTVFTM